MIELDNYRLFVGVAWEFSAFTQMELRITEVEEKKKKELDVTAANAFSFYNNGIKAERGGLLTEAVRNYRIALKLDPNIEKTYRAFEQDEPEEVISPNIKKLDEFEESIETSAQVAIQNSKLLKLPLQILIKILSWCAAFDINSVQKIALCCSNFGSLIRNESIWKFMVEKTCETSLNVLDYNNSWFLMWLKKPRIRKDGVYISKVVYKRTGLADTTTRLANLTTVHIVTYYRYFRFMNHSNVCLISTTAMEPKNVIAKLNVGSKLDDLSSGTYIWIDEGRILVEWKNKSNPSLILSARLNVGFSAPGLANKLSWIDFTSYNRNDAVSSVYTFPMDQLRSFRFSRVKSY